MTQPQPVHRSLGAESPELDCANASVGLSISKEDNVIVVSFMGCPFEFSGQQWSGS
jgi:hypothetical protein